ncbi:MAG: OmpA family protein [Treponema sp.]|nr:OmpA family protein [Treponema sp.]
MKIKKIITISLFFTLLTSSFYAKVRYISPNNDGVQDELVLPLNISEKRYVQGWSLVILDENKEVVRTIENKIALPEKIGFKSFFKQLVTPKQGVQIPESVSWNGAMDNGETAPDGKYFYYLTATDDNGNVGRSKEYEIVVDTIAPEIELQQPTDKIFGEGAKNFFKVTQDGSVEDLWTAYFKNADGDIVKTYTWTNAAPESFKWYGTNEEGAQVADGVYTYEITSTDKAGNVAPQSVITNIIYSAEKPATNIYINGSRYFSPNTESKMKNIVFDVTIPVPEAKTGNELLEWAVQIKDKAGKVVRSYNQDNMGKIPPESITFDGLDDKNALLADGEYQASLTARYSNGYIPAEIFSPVIVLDTQAPKTLISASDKVFGGGTKDTVTFTITRNPDSGAPVPAWHGKIQTKDGLVVRSYDFGEFPPESVVWNGVTDEGKIAENGSYIFVMEAEDLAGNLGGGILDSTVTFDTTEANLLLTMSETAFSPNGNGVKDTISFTPITEIKDFKSIEFTIKDSKNKLVYATPASTTLPVNYVWDGKTNEKLPAPDGFYSASLHVLAANGSEITVSTQNFELDTVAPSLVAECPWNFFSPDGDGNQDNVPITITNSTSEKLWTAEVRDSKDKTIKKITWNNVKDKVVWDGSDESGNTAQDGKYNIIIYSTDDAGNSFSTEFKGITLDTRETKAYITAEFEGISPNKDGYLDAQNFEIRATLTEGIKSWNFDVRREDGTSVYSLSDEGKNPLPAKILWNGLDKDGKAFEGTFTGTLNIDYLKGNKVSAVSSPFICTATAPQLNVQTRTANSGDWFSPDNDGIDDELFIKLTGSTKAKIKNWSFVIKDVRGRDFWRTSGKSQITERIVWDGLSNVQKSANGKAERVQSAMDYPYEFTVTDSLGMTNTYKGAIQVDVLVIREGNVLKMAVPSIIFESDSDNFQVAKKDKLTDEQISKNTVTLDRIAQILKKFKDYKVTIVGHANRTTNDPAEETESLKPLSKKRADAISAYLVKKGVNANSVSTDGMGGTQPVADPFDRDNNWKNRRVEFILEK